MKPYYVYACIVIAFVLQGCGKANGDGGARIDVAYAPDGAKCYVIFAGGTPVGGNCK